MSAAVEVARDITGGIAEGVQDVASAAGSAASSAIATVRNVTGDTYDAIGSAAQKVGNTVEAVLNNPKALAAVAISIAFPAAAPSIGEWVLGAELASAYPAAAAAVGNACLNTAMNGGDVGQAVKTAAIQYIGNVSSQQLTEIVKNADIVPEAFAKNVGTTTTYAAIQAAQGKDPTVALLTGGTTAAAQAIAQEIPEFVDLPKATQDQLVRATAAAIQGNNKGVLNAAIDFGTTFARDEFKAIKDANNAGFGYDADSYRDAKALGILNPEDYRAAKAMGVTGPTPAIPSTETPTTDTSGYAPQDLGITPENLESYQNTLSDNFQGSQWTPSADGDYTLTGDDGSTVTMHQDGTVSSTAAPTENLLDTIGKETTGGTKPTSGTTPALGTTTKPTTGGTTIPPAQAGITPSQQLAGLAALLDSGAQQTQTTTQEETPTGATASSAPPPAAVNYLGELAQKPNYMEGMDPEVASMLQQLGIDPTELMAQQEGDAGEADDHADDHGEEVPGADILEAAGLGSRYSTRTGIQRGLRPGTLSIAGPEVGEAYRAARAKPMSMEENVNYRLPIDDYSKSAYLKQLVKEAEGALSSDWQALVGGKQLTLSGMPTDRTGVPRESIAYVPEANIATSPYYKGAVAPQLIALVGANPELLNDPDYLAAVMSHELAHRPQYGDKSLGFRTDPIIDLFSQFGYNPKQSIQQANEFSQTLAKTLPDLAQRLGYQGFYDTKENAALKERLADLHGWATQNSINLARDPAFAQAALNTPERMAVFNAMSPQRSIQWTPAEAPIGTISLEDFRDMPPPIGWAYKNMDSDQFKAMLKKRMTGMFGQ